MNLLLIPFRWLLVVICCIGLAACDTADPGSIIAVDPPPVEPPVRPPTGADNEEVYDIQIRGIPRFVSLDYIDLDQINRISLFRSGAGHDYHDAFEICRSMKHYFQPYHSVDWGSISIYAPVSGLIDTTFADLFGTQIRIKPSMFPAFRIILFHVQPAAPLKPGTSVTAGQRLGNHIGSMTLSDAAVSVNTPGGFRLVSWFDVMTDTLFARYNVRGISSTDSMIIDSSQRDADPLTCSGETFIAPGNLPDWKVLDEPHRNP